jgi:CheY-like chemotaxis protein/HPt (histidine-containing phosphotransfer) domain-containing protein
MDEGGAVLLGVYLFVTFGNGFRFGRAYLHACQAASIAGFCVALWLSPFWSQHLVIGTGFLTALLVLPLYVGVLTQRITEAKRRADEANAAKGRFLANVSHEMRTPLNGVIAMADVLRETNLNEAQREIVETMTTSAHLLLAQIEDVLDMAKIEAGRVAIETRPFDLSRLATATVKVMLPQARYKGLADVVRVALEPARGLDLTDELVNVRGAAQAGVLPRANVHKIRGARILVAEDNPTNQRVAQLILESGGHQVTIVDNGEAALDALERGGFDLALFDLSMPIVSGLEALKLYRFSTAHPIPVLILSANVTTEAIAECERAGAAEFMPKPLRASLLLDAIERHLADVERPAPPAPARADDRPALQVVDTPPLDPTVLADLARLSKDPTFVERLLRGFKSDTERLLRELGDALGARRYEAAKDAAHALKGGAASVGAMQLVQIATRIEKATHDTLRLKAAQWTEELTAAANRALLALDAHLEQRGREERGGDA